MGMRVARLTICLLVVVALVPSGAGGTSLAEWLDRANRIAVVTITEGRMLMPPAVLGEACRFEYGVRTDRSLRGVEQIQRLVTDAPLTLGTRYLLVVAEQARWIEREFPHDMLPLPSEFEEPADCRKAFPNALLVRQAELRPIDEHIMAKEAWVSFPPQIFRSTQEARKVSDLDRIEFVGDRAEWPNIPLQDHFPLADLISLIERANSAE